MNEDEEYRQKFKNLILFKMWATDKEMDEIMPVLGTILVVVLAIALLVWLVGQI